MKPFLAISFSNDDQPYEEFLTRLSKKTPIDILRVDAKEQNSFFDIYINSPELLSTLKQIRLDYSTILFNNHNTKKKDSQLVFDWIHSIKQPYTQIDLIKNNTIFFYSEAQDIHRHLYIFEALTITDNQSDIQFNQLTIEEIEAITKQTLKSGREELKMLLNAEKLPLLLTHPANGQLVKFELFTDNPQLTTIAAEILLTGQATSLLDSDLPSFEFSKPNKTLYLWANNDINAGKLKYEFKKLLKESKANINEIKVAQISKESKSVEEIISFLESILIDNEIDVTFNKDTIPNEIRSQSNDKSWEILAERSSDNLRLILVMTGF